MKNLFFRVWVAFAACMLAVSVVGCEEETDGGNEDVWSVESKNLVTRYVFPEEMSVRHEYDSSKVLFYVGTKGLAVGHRLEARSEFENLEEDELSRRARLFDSMAVVYKDTSYKGKVPITGYWALAYPIDSISIVSSSDYDMNHPAGTNLSDVVSIESYSFGACVLSGYLEKKVGIGVGFDMKVSELTRENRTLLCAQYGSLYNTGYFSIPQTSNPQDCQLTVTYLFSNGLKLSASAQVKL